MEGKKLTAAAVTLLILLVGLFPGFIRAQDNYQPVYNPTMHINKMNGDIKIDGELNDSGWRGAGKADNFAEHKPGDQTKPPVNTEAFITYDDKNLYVAFICYDDPKTIRATYCDRDAVGGDDNICLLIDTYGEATWAYEFNVNPYGIQGDYLYSIDGGEDEAFNAIWESMGKVTDSGYQLEIAMPFSSLRFPNKPEQTWKIDFWRNHPRDNRRQYSWAAYDRDNPCWACQWGVITGINNVTPGHGLELLPTAIGFQSGGLIDAGNPNSEWDSNNPDGELSIGAKYAVTSNMTAEATINPDFSQVESDVAQIDVNSSFALFYSETRPFFQEGSDLFNTYLNAVYTRSINNPMVAGKVVGRINKTSVAFLTAYDEDSPIIIPLRERSALGLAGESVSNILRVRRAVGDESHLGVLLTDRRFTDDGSGSVYGVDGGIRFMNNFKFEFQVLGSHVKELNEPDLIDTSFESGIGQMYFDGDAHTVALDGESLDGHNIYASLEMETRNMSLDIDYNEESPSFRADNGFVFMNETRSAEITWLYQMYHNTRFVEWSGPQLVFGKVWKYRDGTFKDEWVIAKYIAQLTKQTYAQVSGLISREEFRNKRFNNIKHVDLYVQSIFNRYLSFELDATHGFHIIRNVYPPIMGKVLEGELAVTARPTERLKITPIIKYYKAVKKGSNELIDEDIVVRTKLNYQFTRELYLRFIAQYHDYYRTWQFDPLITYQLNALTVFYIGSTHNFYDYDGLGMKQYQQQFFFKLQYLLQI